MNNVTENIIGSEEYRVGRAQHKFLKQTSPTSRTMLFSQLPSKSQQYLTQKCHSVIQEDLPVVVCYLDQDNWCLVTTRMVHWSRDGQYRNISYADIKQVGWSAGPHAAKRRTYVDQVDLWIDTEDGKKRTKEVSPWFFISDKKGARHELRLEIGNAQTAIWDAIDMLIRLEQIHPRRLPR